MRTDRRWVQRLISEEKPAAAVLLLAGAFGLLVATALGAHGTDRLLHPTLAGMTVDLPWLAADGLLVIFFFVAGLELRHEIKSGSLATVREAAVPVAAAVLGMVVPAVLFLVTAPTQVRDAWGVPMATDLPLALALVAVAGQGLPLEFRAFILSLAIVDDALSILVIAGVFGQGVSLAWCTLTAVGVIAYSFVQRHSGRLALLVASATWLAMLQTGIHPTVLGVILGLVTVTQGDALRDRWQPVSGLIAVPLFVATSLAIPVSASAIDGRLALSITMARVLGKPLGILIGAMLAVRLLHPASRLSARAYATAGSVAGLGFSVSMLFAELGLDAEVQTSVKTAILLAMGFSGVVGALALLGLRRSALSE